jgi:hypothetical protein
MMTGVAAIGTGSVAARLARLERILAPARPQDGDALVFVREGLDGSRDVHGTIGRDSLVIALRVVENGRQ